MNRRMSILLRYGITMVIGALLVWLVLDRYHFADMTSNVDRFRLLADAFTIPGVVFTMIGLLVQIARFGAFEGLGYMGSWLRKRLIPLGSTKQEPYLDYVLRKRQEKKASGFFLILCGLVFLAVAVVFMVLFYQIYKH